MPDLSFSPLSEHPDRSTATGRGSATSHPPASQSARHRGIALSWTVAEASRGSGFRIATDRRSQTTSIEHRDHPCRTNPVSSSSVRILINVAASSKPWLICCSCDMLLLSDCGDGWSLFRSRCCYQVASIHGRVMLPLSSFQSVENHSSRYVVPIMPLRSLLAEPCFPVRAQALRIVDKFSVHPPTT